ncbi:hypothetical protein P3T76_005159 [Phytophthora citrophthora]|uniref:RxLR effector protein n=1 Tax=Phytophthora citrophthora TaxID=4793 RepID=A0AAD9LND2_9STRA|nr:hypothetical protein P3T76_005159 [Phytophthora citrophthora]
MRLFILLLLVVVLVTTNALTTTTESTQSTGATNSRRSLRLTTKNNVDAVKEDMTDTEMRAPGGGGLSSLKSKISDKIPLKVKLAWWQEVVGKSPEYVKKKLGANHPLYLKYKHRHEGLKMFDLASTSYSTYKVWKEQGLDSMITLQPGMKFDDIAAQIKKLEGTEPFRVYKRYANAFDEHRIETFYRPNLRDTYFIDEKASTAEKFVRAHIWAESNRYDEYVREFLGLFYAKRSTLSKDPYYQYFLETRKKLHPKL